MLGLLMLGTIAAVAVTLFTGMFVVAMLVKIVLRLVLLPLLLIKWFVAAILFTVIGPIVFVAGLLAFVVVGAALLVPFLPFIAVALLVWLLVRANRKPGLIPS